MPYNYYTLEQLARDIQADRRREAIKDERWSRARKAARKLAKRS